MKYVVGFALLIVLLKIEGMILVQFLWCMAIARSLDMWLWVACAVFTICGWYVVAEWVRTK
jgi:hypothetical protein